MTDVEGCPSTPVRPAVASSSRGLSPFPLPRIPSYGSIDCMSGRSANALDTPEPTLRHDVSGSDVQQQGGAEADENGRLLESGNSSARRKKQQRRGRLRRWSHSVERRVPASSRRREEGSHGQRRSISQALIHALAGDSDDEDGYQAMQGHRRASTYFLSHPTSNTEAIATWTTTPRRLVSAAVRLEGSAIDDRFDDEDDDGLPKDGMPYGVRKMEVISRYVPKSLLYTAIYLITLFTSLSSTTTPAVEPFLLSLFGGHSYISSIAIVTSIAFAVCKPPMAKILDVFGRAEGLAVSAILYGIGFLLTGATNSIFTFGVAKVIGSAGAQGINLAQQVIVADITSLASRALVTSTIFLPWLITPWIGPYFGQMFKDAGEQGYRAAYTVFGIAVPISCLFLLFALWRAYKTVLRLTRDAKPAIDALKMSADGESRVEADDALSWEPRTFQALAVEAHRELDLLGIFYLMTGCTLFLLPLSLASSAEKGWRDPLYPILAFSGLFILGLLGYHETYVAEFPLIPSRLLGQRTVMSGCCLGAFHFFAQFAYESYFPSFLQVARYYSARDASYISESYVFSASVAALLCGYLVKITRRYKIWMIFGVLVHMVGAYMMVRFRSLDNSTFDLVLSQVIGGFGGGFTTLSAQLGTQAVVDHQDIAIVTAVFLTITQIGGAVGGAASGAIWSTFLPRALRKHLPHSSKKELDGIFGSIAVAISYDPASPERQGINQAYVEVQRYLNLTALLGLLPALIFAMLMQNVKLSVDEPDAPGESVVTLADVLDEDTEGASDQDSRVEISPLRPSRTSDW